MIREFPVWDPGVGGLADLYPYEVEIWIEIDPADVVEDEPFGPDDPTVIQPAASLLERCWTSAAMRDEP